MTSTEIKKRASFMEMHNTDLKLSSKIIFGTDKDGNTLLFNCRTEGSEAVHYLDEKGIERIKLQHTSKRMVADDFDSIVLNRCRHCKGYNTKKYTENYWKINNSLGSSSKTLYCFENGYCEECSKKLATVYNGKRVPKEISRTSQKLMGDQTTTTIIQFDDGSTLEEYPYGMPPHIEREQSVFRHL